MLNKSKHICLLIFTIDGIQISNHDGIFWIKSIAITSICFLYSSNREIY